ncbi:hypothetical protein HanPI659440_Chr09g0337381 [Helianthus annuus]|nr:hypothetical protein HanPI659440_Chr09g0337381 [Helianthus annuus]
MKKIVGTSSSAHASVQQETIAEPVQEAEVNLQFAFSAEEAVVMTTSISEAPQSPPTTTSATETPVVPPPVQPSTAEPHHATSSSQAPRERVQKQSAEQRGSTFERMSESEKVNFLFSQLQAAALQITRHSEVMLSNRQTNIAQQLQINTLKEVVQKQQVEIEQLQAEIAQLRAADNARGIEMNRLKERIVVFLQTADKLSGKYDDITKWYDTRNKTIADNVKQITSSYEMTRKRVNTLWNERCKAQEVLQKRDQDSEDPGNPDVPTASAQPEGSISIQIVSGSSSEQVVTAPVASGGTQEARKKLEGMQVIEEIGLQLAVVESSSGVVGESSKGVGNVVLRSADLALQVRHPVTGEEVEEGEIIFELSSGQIFELNEMKIVDDATIDKIPSEPEVVNLEGLDEIVFEGDVKNSKYVREDGTEFNPFNKNWMKDNVDEIDERLKNRDLSDVPTTLSRNGGRTFSLRLLNQPLRSHKLIT